MNKKRYKYFLVLILLVAGIILALELKRFNDRSFKFYMLNVGAGNAFFIETPSKNQILIGGGPDRSALGELGDVMPFWDRSLDLIILITHKSEDTSGLVDVLKNYDVKKIIDGGGVSNQSSYRELDGLIQGKKIERIFATSGMDVPLDRDVSMSILGADADEKYGGRGGNLILRIVFGNTRFLLMGDAEKPDELSLVSSGADIKSDILQVGHHGSKNSANPLFLDRVLPKYALISVDAKNRYGYPDQNTLDTIAKASAKIFRTDLNSRIEVISDSVNFKVVSKR